MKKRIVLHGALAREFGSEFLFNVSTPAEAVRALCANFKNFDERVRELSTKGIGYKLLFGTRELERDEEFYEPISNESFEIVPVLTGAGAIGRIVLGAALIAASFIPGLQGVTIPLLGTALTTTMVGVGVALALGGVAQLLASDPQTPTATGSYLFNGQVNTTAQGHPVPICYGRMIVGSALISGGVDVEEITA